MNLIAENNGFALYFNCSEQIYEVYKDGKFLISGYKLSDVECYMK